MSNLSNFHFHFIIRLSYYHISRTVSLSHRIADGATFYNLYQMLDPNEPLRALDPTRKPEVFEGIEALSNQKIDSGVSGPIFNLLFSRDRMRNYLSGIFGRGAPQFHHKTFLLDAEYLNEIKASHDPAKCYALASCWRLGLAIPLGCRSARPSITAQACWA